MTPQATGGGPRGVTEAEVKNMIANGIDDYDDRISKPRQP
jgi:hypothetical protein